MHISLATVTVAVLYGTVVAASVSDLTDEHPEFIFYVSSRTTGKPKINGSKLALVPGDLLC
jgi:hypothetical protein